MFYRGRLSVTAIANGLQFPQRYLGMHFFNPVALMKLLEVVSGLQTSNEVSADPVIPKILSSPLSLSPSRKRGSYNLPRCIPDC
jgi:hypothetical protein